MSMNFHYLPPMLRFRLLERYRQQRQIVDLIVKQNLINYDDVKSIKIVKPTIKYLYAYYQTGFLRINADEVTAIYYLYKDLKGK